MWSIAVEGREVGLAYSLTGRGEVGGASEALLPGRLWLVSRSGELSGSNTLRRWSRGMAGTRNYIYKGSRIGALTRRWWLDWYWYWYW